MKPAPGSKPDAEDQPDTEDQSDALKQSSETTESTAGFTYNFPRVTISGGTILFSDKTLDYPFEYKIENLNIESAETSDIPQKISVKILAGFIANYLSGERAIPPERFRVIETTPDSIISEIKYPVFRIYFTAGE